jgi:hypothetical protein
MREYRRLAWLPGAFLFVAFLFAPASGVGVEEKPSDGKGEKDVEISCIESKDDWQSILTLGPVDSAGKETTVSEVIKVTLKYRFVHGSQRRRLTLFARWASNAELDLEINPKQICASKGAEGIRTTVKGQTKVLDNKAPVKKGYIRILPEHLD